MKTCFCGTEFEPENRAQKYCCPRHQRIHARAQQSAFGADLVRKNPAAALRWYDYVV